MTIFQVRMSLLQTIAADNLLHQPRRGREPQQDSARVTPWSRLHLRKVSMMSPYVRIVLIRTLRPQPRRTPLQMLKYSADSHASSNVYLRVHRSQV